MTVYCRWVRPCLFLIAVLSIAASPLVRGQPDQSRDRDRVLEFLAWCQEVMPERGAIVVEYVSDATVRGSTAVYTTTCGFDASSGAWFKVTPSGSGGRTAAGVPFSGGTTHDSTLVVETPWGMPVLGIADRLPMAFLRFFVDEPDHIKSIAQSATGNWTVGYHQPGPDEHARPLGFVEIAPSGKVVRSWTDDPHERRSVEYVYDDRSPEGFPVAVQVGGAMMLRVTSVEYNSAGLDDVFTMERAEAFAREAFLKVETERQARRAGYITTETGEWVRESATPKVPATYGDSGVMRWRWPLLVAGAAVTLMALIEIWRRRSSR